MMSYCRRIFVIADGFFSTLRIMDLIKPNFEEGGVGVEGATPP
jgi:hypothetical protein